MPKSIREGKNRRERKGMRSEAKKEKDKSGGSDEESATRTTRKASTKVMKAKKCTSDGKTSKAEGKVEAKGKELKKTTRKSAKHARSHELSKGVIDKTAKRRAQALENKQAKKAVKEEKRKEEEEEEGEGEEEKEEGEDREGEEEKEEEGEEEGEEEKEDEKEVKIDSDGDVIVCDFCDEIEHICLKTKDPNVSAAYFCKWCCDGTSLSKKAIDCDCRTWKLTHGTAQQRADGAQSNAVYDSVALSEGKLSRVAIGPERFAAAAAITARLGHRWSM